MTLKKPEILKFEYAKFTFENNAYFLLSWQLKNTNSLTLSEAKFKSKNSGGSTYLKIAPNVNSIEICLHNVWHKFKFSVAIQEISINKTIEYNLNYSSSNIIPTKVKTKAFSLKSIKISPYFPIIRPNKFKAKISNLKIN